MGMEILKRVLIIFRNECGGPRSCSETEAHQRHFINLHGNLNSWGSDGSFYIHPSRCFPSDVRCVRLYDFTASSAA